MNGTSQTITAFDAKNRLGRLLDRVVAGEELVITRHGEPVAKLIPIDENVTDSINQALATFQAIRKSLKKKGIRISQEDIRSWKNEGRR